jgi:hypothetical protein
LLGDRESVPFAVDVRPDGNHPVGRRREKIARCTR